MNRVLLMAALAACSSKSSDPVQGGKRGGGAKLQYAVDVSPLVARQQQYAVNQPCTVEAFQQVQITARVAGAVDKVAFVEGQQVKQGDPLVVIESERYQIAVEQAKAAVAKAQSAQKSAEAALGRREDAQKESPGLVPGEEIEQKQTAVDTAKADVLAAKQAQRVAELNLRDSSVRAPIPGVVQTRTVNQGQYLQPGAVLATILQKDPMLVRFQVSEQDAPRLKPDMPVTITLNESQRQFTGKITLVSDAADVTTRQVPVTVTVDPTEHQYWLRPGAFCKVSVPIGTARPGIVVPQIAVQPTEKGQVVYVVEGGIAHARVVETGMHTGDGGVELTRGVKEGEQIVVRGIDPLTDGAPVKIDATLSLDDAMKPPPDSPPPPPAGAQGSGAGSGGHHRRGSAP